MPARRWSQNPFRRSLSGFEMYENTRPIFEKHIACQINRKQLRCHCVKVFGVEKLPRPYHAIHNYFLNKFSFVPEDIDLSPANYHGWHRIAAVYFPLDMDIRPIFMEEKHEFGRNCWLTVLPHRTHYLDNIVSVRKPRQSIMNRVKPHGSNLHKSNCIIRRLTTDCWHLIVKLLDPNDLFSFQTVCSCARDVANLYFEKDRQEFTFEYDKVIERLGDSLLITRCHLLNYTNVMNIVIRHNLRNIVSLTLNMQSACSLHIEDNLFQLLKANCVKLKELCIINGLYSTWCRDRQVDMPTLEKLSLKMNSMFWHNDSEPIMRSRTAKYFFGKALRNLKLLELCNLSIEKGVINYLPTSLLYLKLSGKYDELPMEMIRYRLPLLRALALKVRRGKPSPDMPHVHFLDMEQLKELKLKDYPLYRGIERSIAFVPFRVKRLSLTRMTLTRWDLIHITRSCPHLQKVELRHISKLRFTSTSHPVTFHQLTELEELVLDNADDGHFPQLVDHLPESLEQLTIVHHGAVCHVDVCELIAYGQEKLTDLETMAICFPKGLVANSEDININFSRISAFEFGTQSKVSCLKFGSRYTVRSDNGDRQWSLWLGLV